MLNGEASQNFSSSNMKLELCTGSCAAAVAMVCPVQRQPVSVQYGGKRGLSRDADPAGVCLCLL